MSENPSGTPDNDRPPAGPTPPPSESAAAPESAAPAGGAPGEVSPPPPALDPASLPPAVDPFAPPLTGGEPWMPGTGVVPPPVNGSTPGYGPPSGYGPPVYGPPASGPPGYHPQAGSNPPPAYGPPSYGQPGNDQPSAYGPPGYGPPAYGPPGYNPPGNDQPPAFGPPLGYGLPAYAAPGVPPAYLPSSYYAGPTDPLVSADFGGWWARSFRLLQGTWQPIALVQLVSVVPLFGVSVAAALTVGSQFTELTAASDPDTIDWPALWKPFVVLLPFLLVAVLLSLVTQLATLRLLVQVATGQPVSIGAALRDGLRRMPALLGWYIPGGLLIVLGFVFCILPGFYVLAVLMVLPAIVLLERGTGIGRAFQLFHAGFGAALARVATIAGLTIGVGILEAIFTGVISPAGDQSIATRVLSEVFSAGFSIATAVLVTPMILTAYADMRARHEPFSTAYLTAAP